MFEFDVVICFGIRSALHAFSQELNFQHGTQLFEKDLPIIIVGTSPSIHTSFPP